MSDSCTEKVVSSFSEMTTWTRGSGTPIQRSEDTQRDRRLEAVLGKVDKRGNVSFTELN